MEVTETRSVIVNKFGGYDCLSVDVFKLPELEGLIEVKVDYGGLNFADLYTRQGLMMYKAPPFVLGMECAGTVVALGTTKTDLFVGQKVVCYDHEGGMYRDIIRVSPDKCYPLPDFVDTKIGAAIFVNYLTAYFTLFYLGNLKEQEKVLILSCAGGVGCAATQLAKTVKDVKIFGTASKEKEDEAKNNGVDIFYSNESFTKETVDEKFDLIVTNVAGSMCTLLQDKLNPLGRIVMIGANNIITNSKRLGLFDYLKAWWNMKYINPQTLIVNNRVVSGLHLGTLAGSNPEVVRKALKHIFELYKTDITHPKIFLISPMSKIAEATKILGDRKNIGKVLIEIWHYHETTLVHNLPCLLESDVLTDVTLSVGTQHVKAHKIILAMCSVYFLQLFQEMKTTHPVVVLHNVSIDDVRAILSFVYRGQCVVSQEQLPSLLSVAKLLKIQGLCDMKVPEKQVQNDLINEPEYVHEKIPNEERHDSFNYTRFKEPKQPESIEIKRQSIDRLPITVQDVCHETRIYPQNAHFHEKTAQVASQQDPFRYEDQPFNLQPRKNPTKDPSETCKCFLCGKYLSNQYNLRVHMETHEEAYHACQSCPHVSRSRDALRKHVSYRHPEEYHTRKRKKTDSL